MAKKNVAGKLKPYRVYYNYVEDMILRSLLVLSKSKREAKKILLTKDQERKLPDPERIVNKDSIKVKRLSTDSLGNESRTTITFVL